MRWVVVVWLVSACGFSSRVESMTADEAPIDAPVEIDAAPDALLMWTVVESFPVNTADPMGRSSTMVLENGVTYRLRVSGTAIVIDGIAGDGEYYDFANPKDLACCEDVGLGIDDPVVDKDTTPDWGPYNAQHIYEIEWVGTGGTIKAVYQDTVYGNNSGNLMLEILALR